MQQKSVSTGYRTDESVSPKHPDNLCNRISDAILDAHLAEDPDARVAVDAGGVAEPLETTVIIDSIPIPQEITSYDPTPQGILETMSLRRPIF